MTESIVNEMKENFDEEYNYISYRDSIIKVFKKYFQVFPCCNGLCEAIINEYNKLIIFHDDFIRIMDLVDDNEISNNDVSLVINFINNYCGEKITSYEVNVDFYSKINKWCIYLQRKEEYRRDNDFIDIEQDELLKNAIFKFIYEKLKNDVIFSYFKKQCRIYY